MAEPRFGLREASREHKVTGLESGQKLGSSGAGYWATEQDLPRKPWPLAWRKTIRSGREARVPPPGLAFER